MNNFQTLLYQLRKEKGFTQAELGEKLGVTDKAVSRWETGESFPETAQLIPLADIFDITVDELLRGVKATEENVKNQELKLYLESIKGNHFPFSKKEKFFMALSVTLILIGSLISFLLYFMEDKIYFLTPFLALSSITMFPFIIIGCNKMMRDGKISDDIIKKNFLNVLIIATGVFFIILALIPISIMIFTEFKLVLIIIAGILLIIGIFLDIFGGIGFNEDALSKISHYSNVSMPKKYKILSIIWSTLVMLAIALYVVIGLITGVWHPTWIIFIIALFIGIIISTIMTTGDYL